MSWASWRRHTVPLLAILLLWLVGFPALDQYNVTWDEALGDLFFGERYLSYFTSFDPIYLDFEQNPYPPERRPDLFVSPFKIRPWEYYPVANTLAAASSELLSRRLGLLDPFDGYHALNLLLAALLIAGLYGFVARRAGQLAAGVTIGLLFTAPRVVSHMFANIKDFPLMVLYALTLILFFQAYEAGSGRRLLAAGLLWGLTLGTKANALFLPAIPMAFALWPWLPQAWQGRRKQLVLWTGAAGAVGGLTLLASWPYLWADPLGRLWQHLSYIGFRAGYTRPESIAPAFEAVWLTTPLPFLVLYLVGVVVCLRRLVQDRDRLALLLLLWPAVVMGRFLLPQSVNFDGVRHFLELFPAMAATAGLGAASLIRFAQSVLAKVRPALAHRAVRITAAGLLLAPGAWATLLTHPFEIAYWNSIAGGYAGARAKGLPQASDYWGMSYRLGIDWLNENAEPDSLLVVPVVEHAVRLVAPERLRPDITLLPITTPFSPRIAPERLARLRQDARDAPVYVMFVDRRDWRNEVMMDCLRFLQPEVEWQLEGEPVLAIYRYRVAPSTG